MVTLDDAARPLASSGMFAIRFRDKQGRTIFPNKPVKVDVPTERYELGQGFYTLNDTGVWQLVEPIQPNQDSILQHGKSLFENECKTCHRIDAQLVGPSLAFIHDFKSRDWFVEFSQNPMDPKFKKDSYTQCLFAKWLPMAGIMNKQDLSYDELSAIYDYIGYESTKLDRKDIEDLAYRATCADATQADSIVREMQFYKASHESVYNFNSDWKNIDRLYQPLFQTEIKLKVSASSEPVYLAYLVLPDPLFKMPLYFHRNTFVANAALPRNVDAKLVLIQSTSDQGLIGEIIPVDLSDKMEVQYKPDHIRLDDYDDFLNPK